MKNACLGTTLARALAVAAMLAAAATAVAENPFQKAIRAASPSVVRIIAASRSVATRQVQFSIASGVILTKDGYLVTSYSALGGSRRPMVTLPDGTEAVAVIVKADAKADAAILKVKADGLRPADMDESPVRVGEWALCIGNPFGLSQTRTDPLSVAVGVISSFEPVEATDYAYTGPVIITDVIVNPGASGGALVDLDGRLVGVCGRVITSKHTNTQLSFALPVSFVTKLLDEARKLPLAEVETPSGTPPAPGPTLPAPTTPRPAEGGYLGAYIVDEAQGTRGAYVQQVVPGSPAEAAGLEEGDLVTAINGETVRNGHQLIQQLDALVIGARVEITVSRDRAQMKFTAMLSKPPKPALK